MDPEINKFIGKIGIFTKLIFILGAGIIFFIEYKSGKAANLHLMDWFGGSVVIILCAVMLGTLSLTFPRQMFKSNSTSFFYDKGPYFILLGLALFMLNLAIYISSNLLHFGSVLIGVFFFFYGSARTARYIKDKVDKKASKTNI